MNHKPFKTLDEQLDLLEGRGLLIQDREFAKGILREENYYRLSGYTLTLRKDDKFYKDVRFEDVMQLYCIDKELRIALMAWLEDIEISLRSHIAYELGKFDVEPDSRMSYLRPETFVSEEHYIKFISDLQEAHKDSNSEAFVKHHDAHYGGLLPVWAMVETLSFGTLSRMFAALNIDLKKQISENYYKGINGKVLDNWFESLVVLRNMCAHHLRLINRGIPMTPMFSNKLDEYFKEQGYHGNAIGKRVFFRLILIAKLSKNTDAKLQEIVETINALHKKYPFADLNHYGFMRNWEDILYKATK